MSLTSYAVVGAAAYMGGATRMTLTTTVMVMETTGALQLIVPIIITVFVAKVSPKCARYRSCICARPRRMLIMTVVKRSLVAIPMITILWPQCRAFEERDMIYGM